MASLSVIPALPVEEIAPAVAFYVRVYGFASRHADDGMAVLARDQIELHLWAASDRSWQDRPSPAAGPTSEADPGAAAGRSPVCSGAESFLAGTASCRIHETDLDGLYARLKDAGVLHPTDQGRPVATDYGTVEFHTLDLAGNLISFFDRR